MLRPLAIAVFVAASLAATSAAAREPGQTPVLENVDAVLIAQPAETRPRRHDWVYSGADSRRASVTPPSKLAIIACRVEPHPRNANSLAPHVTEPDWRLPVECMRVIETVADAAAMSRQWLRQMNPNLSNHETCVEVAMTYAPIWEASHRNWVIVKVGCPTRIVDADGRVIGWHMPECQGTLPGTTYPLRCRFDPSEI